MSNTTHVVIVDAQKKRVLIYCRVSSERQAKEGHGLDSQEHRCREYARAKGYEVEEVFRDSVSGGGDFMCRPAMQELLEYADDHPHRDYIVIFDDLSRFARDVVFHVKLRQAFAARGLTPQCLNFNFDDSPEGEMVEIMMAAQNQYHRKNNRRQVIQKQTARLEKGYWPFYPPPGYQQVKDPIHGKILKPVEPQASIIREAFEGFASDRFLSQADVVKFLQNAGYSNAPIYQEGVRRLLRRAVYAGYVEREEWGVSRRKGQHAALVSLDTYEKVQAKLDGKCKVRVRVSDSLDFVLRGFVLCSFCNRPMTGSWTRGRSKMYRFLRCNTKSCVRHNKSISADRVDNEFEKLLEVVYPKAGAIQLTKTVMVESWQQRVKGAEGRQMRLEKALADTGRDIDAISARIVKVITDERLVRIYEDQITKLRKEAELLQEQLKTLGVNAVSFGTALEVVLGFLEKPRTIWKKEDLNAKRLVLKLVFAEKLAFHPKFGFETVKKSPLIGLFETVSAKNSQDVEVGRIELPSKEK
jgi:site-specific DNA recombinase